MSLKQIFAMMLHVHVLIVRFVLVMALGAITLIAAQALGLAPFWKAAQSLESGLDPTVAMWMFPGYVYLGMIMMVIFFLVVHTSLSNHLRRQLDLTT